MRTAAVAEERVVLARQLQVGERLVAADVERADDDRPAAGIRDGAAVCLELFVLGRRRIRGRRTASPCGRGRCPRRPPSTAARHVVRARRCWRRSRCADRPRSRQAARRRSTRARGARPAASAPARSSARPRRPASVTRTPRSASTIDPPPVQAGGVELVHADERRHATRAREDDRVRRRPAVGEDEALQARSRRARGTGPAS